MNRTIITIITLLVAIINLKSENIRLKGEVTDEGGAPIPGASCLAFLSADSTYLVSTLSDEQGIFELTCKTDSVYLKISSVGFESRNIDIPKDKITSDNGERFLDLNKIILPAQNVELAEVVVKAAKPQLTVENGNLVYNVDELLRRNSYVSAHALLLDLPLLFSEDGKTIELSGAPLGSTIYINGRKSKMDTKQLIAYLQSLPAKNILNVEIVYLPGPKWGTRESVINVRLRKEKEYSVTGRVEGEYMREETDTYRITGTAMASVPKWSTYVSYTFADARHISPESEYGTQIVNGEKRDFRIDSEERSRGNVNYLYGSITFDPNESSSFDLVYNGSFQPSNHGETKTTSNLFPEETGLYDRTSKYNGLYLSYSYKQKLDAYVSWGNNISNLTSGYKSAEGLHDWNLTHSTQKNNNLNAQINMSLPAGKGWELSFGGGTYLSFTNTSQNSDMPIADGNTAWDYTSFRQNELTAKAYFGVSKSFFNNKLYVFPSVSASYFKTASHKTFDIYPYITLTYTPAQQHYFQFAFSSSRSTPSLWEMANTLQYVDSYHLQVGNPNLVSANTYIENLVYVFKNKYVATLSATQQTHPTLTIPYQSPDYMIQIQQPGNFTRRDWIQASISAPVTFGFYTCNIALYGSYHTQYAADWNGMEIDTKDFYGSVRMRNTFTILTNPKLTGHINAFYATPVPGDGYQRYSERWSLSAGLSISLLSDNLSIKAFAYDIFNTSSYRKHWIHHGTQDMNWDNHRLSREFDITISYSFKGYKYRNTRNLQDSRVGM